LANIASDLAAVGCTMQDVVKAHGWISQDVEFAPYNLGYINFFPLNNTGNPARAMSLGVPLNGNNARIELEVVAYGCAKSRHQHNSFLQ